MLSNQITKQEAFKGRLHACRLCAFRVGMGARQICDDARKAGGKEGMAFSVVFVVVFFVAVSSKRICVYRVRPNDSAHVTSIIIIL